MEVRMIARQITTDNLQVRRIIVLHFEGDFTSLVFLGVGQRHILIPWRQSPAHTFLGWE